MSRNCSGMQPPDGPPVCTALRRLPSGIPPPISKTISRSVMPIGTSISPVFCTRPASAKTFVPLLFSVPMDAYQAPAVPHDRRNIRERFHVVDQRRAAPETRFRGIRRPGFRIAASAFDRGDQRGFFATNECTCAQPDVDIERERRAADIIAEEAQPCAPA